MYIEACESTVATELPRLRIVVELSAESWASSASESPVSGSDTALGNSDAGEADGGVTGQLLEPRES